MMYSRIYPFGGGRKQVKMRWAVGFENKFEVLKISRVKLKIKTSLHEQDE
jgi:hypothetical protein